MSFHTDAMDFVNSFVAVRNSMKTDGKDAYWEWMLQNDPAYKKAQIEKEAKKRQAAQDAAAAKAAAQPPAPVTTSGVNMPAPGAIATAPNMGDIQGQDMRLQHGGVIPHYQEGTLYAGERQGPQQVGEDALSPEDIEYIRRMGAEADARSRPQPILPSAPAAIDVRNPSAVRSSRAGGYDPRPGDPTTGTEFAGQGSMPQEEPSSGIGRWVGSLTQSSPEAGAIGELNAKINALVAERQRVDPGMIAQTTGPQRAAAQARIDQIDAEVAALTAQKQKVGGGDQPTTPTAPTATTPTTPQPPPTSAGGAPTLPPPLDGSRVGPGIAQYEQEQYLRNRKVPPGAGTGGSPGTEPPPGSIPIPGGGGGGGPGGGAGRRSGGRPKLGVQSRVEQYDPTLDKDDPGNVAPVFAGGAVNPVQYAKIQDAAASYDKALAGGLNFAEFLSRRGEGHPHSEQSRFALHAGVGAMSVPVAQAAAAAYSMGGRLQPPDALVRYMMTQFEIMTERGETAMANQMAFEVIQRLNLEAARYGQMAMQQLRQGNVPAALKLTQAGHRWSADGKIMQISPDGRQLIMFDQFTGKPTSAPIQITPQAILAGALSLSDGTGMWNHLAGRAQMFLQGQKPTDKDAEGRMIRNRNNLMRGELLKRKLTAPAGGGAAVGAPPIMDQFRQTAHGTPSVGGKTINIRQGSEEDDTGGRDDVGDTRDD